jgi:hypothetical protein
LCTPLEGPSLFVLLSSSINFWPSTIIMLCINKFFFLFLSFGAKWLRIYFAIGHYSKLVGQCVKNMWMSKTL